MAMVPIGLLISVGLVSYSVVRGSQTNGPQYFVAIDKSYTEPISHSHVTNRLERRYIFKIGINGWGFLVHAVTHNRKSPRGLPYNFAG